MNDLIPLEEVEETLTAWKKKKIQKKKKDVEEDLKENVQS